MTTQYTGTEFNNNKMHVDGGKFENCIFNGGILIYSGGIFPKFFECTFNNVSWSFEGHALNTVEFLRSLHVSVGFRPVVDDLIKYITSEQKQAKES